MGTVPVAISHIDGGNNGGLISCEAVPRRKGRATELSPIFFGRMCQSRKKAGTALAHQV